jgi:site-specific recombinase XerD
VFVPPKGGRTRTGVVPAELLPALREHRTAQAAARLHAGSAWRDHDVVFAEADGMPIDPSHDRRDWLAVLNEAQVRTLRVHDARHTAGTMLLELGVDIRVVQAVLGHAQISTTQIYVHVADRMKRDASKRMGAAFLTDFATTPATTRQRHLRAVGANDAPPVEPPAG